MMDYIKEQIKYPIFNIGIGACDEIFFPNLFFHNAVFYDKRDLVIYYKYFHDKEYVDVKGNVYRSVDAKDVSSWLRKRFHLQRRYKIVFKEIEKNLKFDTVKKEYLKCLNGFTSDEAGQKHVEFAYNCKTIEELL